jgi:gamma-glutamyltranspeptidase/glutathione hydrolase
VEDFTGFEVLIGGPTRIRYRGYDVLGIPVPSGCTTMLQTLNILENFDLGSLDHNSTEHLHLFIEAARHAFADRYRYLGDPEYVPVPLRGMLSTEYASEVARAIDRDGAALEDERERQPWLTFADATLHDPWLHDDRPKPDDELWASPPSEGDCTTHFGVIDKDRNMVACTQTAVGSFGSCVVTPGTGVLFTNGMVTFNPMPGAANSIVGGKQSLANMVPTLVLRDGMPFLSVGAPGGRKIMNCITQIVTNIVDHGMGIQEAIGVPRVDAADRETYVDSRIDESTVEALQRMGHNIAVVQMDAAHTGYLTGFARPSGLMVDPESNRVHAGAEVFNLTEARGY